VILSLFIYCSSKNAETQKYESAANHIRLISEGSCDTEDWSNDAENSFYNKFKQEKKRLILNFNNISDSPAFLIK